MGYYYANQTYFGQYNCKTVELEDSSFKNYGKHQARLNTIQSQAAAKSLNHTELPETL